MAEADLEPQYRGRRVLVTGASGFIGARLCRRLEALGAEVVATSRTPIAAGASITWRPCDLSDASATQALIDRTRPERLFHLASHVVGTRATSAVPPTVAANLLSTVNLLMAAQQCGCQRVVLTGSLEEPDPGPAWPVPSSPYAAAKMAANAYGRMFHALFGLPVVILRVFMVYGPGQRDHAKLVPYVITSLLKGEMPRLGSGLRDIDWVFVDDVVDAFVRAGVAPKAIGATIDVGSGELVTVRRVVELLFEMLRPGEAPVFGDIGDRALEQIRVAQVDATDELTGWRPTVVLRDGLRRTIDFYRGSPGSG